MNKKIKYLEKLLKNEGFVKGGSADTKTLGIYELAKHDKILFGMYLEFYGEGSKYEHSDYSSLNIYRQKALDEESNEGTFIMDLSRTDEELGRRVLNLSLVIYIKTFFLLLNHINKVLEGLIPEKNLIRLALLTYKLDKIEFEIT